MAKKLLVVDGEQGTFQRNFLTLLDRESCMDFKSIDFCSRNEKELAMKLVFRSKSFSPVFIEYAHRCVGKYPEGDFFSDTSSNDRLEGKNETISLKTFHHIYEPTSRTKHTLKCQP